MKRIMILAAIVCLISCNEKSTTYYPIQSSILEDLHALDSLPLVITHTQTRSNQTDTSLAQVDELRKLILELLDLDWNSNNNQKKYDEYILNDPSSNNTSFTYTAKEGIDNPIQKIQINFKPEASTPKSLYAERLDLSGDVRILRKILWTKETSLSVTSSYYQNGVLRETVVDQFNWGFH